MVAKVRSGMSMRAVARAFHVSLLTVQRWVQRAQTHRWDRVEWSDRPPIPQHTSRTDAATEDLILQLRHELKTQSALGEYGAQAIHRELRARGQTPVPAVSTIGRILERRGVLDGQHRVRRPAPPRGWYLPPVAAGQAELDSFDIVEGLVIQGGLEVEVLTGISLWGGLPAAWPGSPCTARRVVDRLTEHWRQFGLPTYAQFDNDTRFQGAHQHRDSIGRVMRLCLSLSVVPVFTPVQEPGFQAAVENFNGGWQSKVWHRFRHTSYPDLRERSDAYLRARRQRAAGRIEAIPRRGFPASWHFDLQAPLHGTIIFLRRTSEQGTATLLGRRFDVDPTWSHRLVRCEVDLDAHDIRFYALRRRDPGSQPLLGEVSYTPPSRRFLE
jgi:hypothetical protein